MGPVEATVVDRFFEMQDAMPTPNAIRTFRWRDANGGMIGANAF